MSTSPPKHGDIRVCYVPLIADHAVVIDVPDVATAKYVHDAVTAISVAEVEHGLRLDSIDLIVQRFQEDGGWDEIDPSEYNNQKTQES